MAQKVNNIDYLVVGDPARARATAQQALEARKFKVAWTDDWTGTAERGSKVANAIAGAAAQYFKVGLRLTAADEGHTTVRIEKQSSGWMGGAIGASRTTKNFTSLHAELTETFTNAGVLVSVQEA